MRKLEEPVHGERARTSIGAVLAHQTPPCVVAFWRQAHREGVARPNPLM